MLIKDVFSRDLDRTIKSVIRAQDESTIVEEIDEFVLTNDTAKQLSDFLEEYVDGSDQQSVGVWFSGFFGSGKSHLLKLVAHLLGEVADSTVDPKRVSEAFEQKALGTSTGVFLQGLVKKVSAIRAKVLLFNIADNFKAGGIDEEAITLRVFVEVWNQSLGLSKVLGVANFEKLLIEGGVYEKFVEAFESDSGLSWVEKRHSAQAMPAQVASAYRTATGGEVSDDTVLMLMVGDKYPSPKEFAKELEEWLDKSTQFDRVVFMVDEVGMFIGGDSRRMLDMQSIMESMFSLNRRVWVGVTSQEDLDNILKKATFLGNDFQKISQRFKLRFQLTSTSVREVIQKRLLDKKEGAKDDLTKMYRETQTNLSAALTFRDGSKNSEPYKDEIDFVQTYPLVGWHLDILTEAMREISDRQGFTGAMVDVGARSTLGIFQAVIQTIGQDQLGTLVTLDKMYEGISDLLKIPYKQSIELVDQHGDSPLKSRVIRVLLLVKHVGYFRPTPDNLAALLFSSVSESKAELAQQVEEALKSLTHDLFVERRGNDYFYLTSIEKDIEKEISKVSIEPSDIDSQIFDLLQNAYSKNFFRHEASGRDFKFNMKIDDYSKGNSNNELTLRFVRTEGSEQTEIARTSGLPELRVLLDFSNEFDGEVLHLMKTQRFLNQHSGSADPAEHAIVAAKHQSVSRMKEELRAKLVSQLSSATLASNGQKLDVPESTDVVKRLSGAWQLLVKQIYMQLDLAANRHYSSDEIKNVLTSGQGEFAGELPLGASAVNTKVLGLNALNQSVDLKKICAEFETRPYGWELNTVLFFVATLVAAGEVVVRRDGKVLAANEVARDITNTSISASLLLQPAPKINQDLITKAKAVLTDDFGLASVSSDSIVLGRDARSALEGLVNDCTAYMRDSEPFAMRLGDLLSASKNLLTKSDEELISTSLPELQAIGALKIKDFNPIKMFHNNSNQMSIYKQAVALYQSSSSDLRHFGGHDGNRVIELISDEQLLAENKIPELNQYLDAVSQKLTAETSSIVDGLSQSLKIWSDSIRGTEIFSNASQESKESFDEAVSKLHKSWIDLKSPSAAQAAVSRFKEESKVGLIGLLIPDAGVPEHALPSIPLSVLGSKVISAPILETEAQIDEYVASLRSVLLEAAKTNRIIR